MADAIRVGILGLGRSGWRIHADTVAGHPGYDLVAVADPVEERRREAEERFGCRSYSDPAGAIADDEVELVVVATPSHTHVPLTLEALAAGRHVVVEKPMAQTAAGVDRMMAAAERGRTIVTCYLPRRLDSDFLAVRDVVSSGRLGDLVMVRRALHRFERRVDWQMLREFDGGELSNAVPHLLDQVLHFVEPGAVELFVDLRHTVGAGDAEDHAKLTVQPVDGPLLEVEASACVAIAQPDWLVIGTAGALTCSAEGLTLRWSDPTSWKPIEVDAGPAAGRRYGSGEELEWFTEQSPVVPATRPAAAIFYDRLERSVRGGSEFMITPESVRRQLEIIERARQRASR